MPIKQSRAITEWMLLKKFGYQCIFKIDESKKFLFEFFIPVDLKNKESERI